MPRSGRAPPDRQRTVIITARTVISGSCGEVTSTPGSPDDVTGRERGGRREFGIAGENGELPRVFGVDEWAQW